LRIKFCIISFILLLILSSPALADSRDTLLEKLSETGMPDTSAAEIYIGPLMVPQNSGNYSDILSLRLAVMSSVQTPEDTASLFERTGFSVLAQENYDKEPDDPSHTCAYTIGKGKVLKGLAFRDALLVSIRGTAAGEWYSNFDFCPSRKDDVLISENFLFAACDVFTHLKEFIDRNNDQLILICGHSRGGACANLLGLLVNEYTDPSLTYVYTYASANTIMPGAVSSYTGNIFNIINPSDIIPMLPFSSWGFGRAGTDIVLNNEAPDLTDIEAEYIRILSDISPDISSYYNDRHALDSSGISEYGITSYEAMLILSTQLTDPEDNDTASRESPYSKLSESVSESSDLRGLLNIADDLSENDYKLGIDILMQHMPAVYLKLLQEK